MKPKIALAASLIAACSLAFSAQAAPPEGKGPGNNAAKQGQGNPNKAKGNPGNNGKGNPGKGNNAKPEKRSNFNDDSRGGRDRSPNYRDGSERRYEDRNRASKKRDDYEHRYDDRGRYRDYFDDRRDRRGNLRSGDVVGGLVYAGITAALARQYASDYGLSGYSSLPPGIRKNLARGKPLPPGIAKKAIPNSLRGRLPRHEGYEWIRVGSDLILVAAATNLIADILYDIFN